jgi:transitional endoplasmic reticulum ATPase
MTTETANTDNNGETNWDMSDITKFIAQKGNRLVIPDGMTPNQAHIAISKWEDECEQEVKVHETIRCFPMDGAVAFTTVLKEMYGWTHLIATESMFGPMPPTLIGVEIAYEKTIQIPWGRMTVPKIDGYLQTGYGMDDNLPCFILGGCVKRKSEKAVSEIAARVRQHVGQHSIYRGGAIRLNMRDGDGERIEDYGPSHAPKFLDPAGVKVDEIVYSDFTTRMLKTNLFNLVEFPDKCRTYNIPLKRGILLAGAFGTGKTLTADLLAKKCVERGWTFLYLEDARDLDITLGLANLYAPCVVFAEDVDKITQGQRDIAMDKLFNCIDGVEGKGREVMVVLTTNSLEKIHPGFLRPGRIDTVVQITEPDPQAVARLVNLYGRDHNGSPMIHASQEDIIKAMRPVQGANAAFIREVVERAKLSALAHAEDKSMCIKADDLYNAALTMKPHVDLLYPERANENDPLGEVMEGEMVDPVTVAMDILVQKFSEKIIDQFVNPKTIQTMIKKGLKKKRGGSSFN